jgi:cAMP-dependent protein kinase regulator
LNAELRSHRLAQIALFRGMNDSELRQLADIARVDTAEAGDFLLRQGEESQLLLVLLEGRCDVLKQLPPGAGEQQPILLATLEPNQHCGEMSFFHRAPHSASIRATTAVQFLQIDRAEYSDLIGEGASAAYKLAYNGLQTTAERLRRMDDWVVQLLSDHRQPQSRREWTLFREKLFAGLNL